MFERFTDRARTAMGLSKAEAQRRNDEAIGTEHLLLGLAQLKAGVAARILREMNVDLERVRAEVEKSGDRGRATVKAGMVPFTPGTKRSLELAVEEATGLGHHELGTEHLLLGLIREHEGVAARVLSSLGVELEAVRDRVRELRSAPASRSAAPPAPTEAPVRSSRASFSFDRFTDRSRKVLELARSEANDGDRSRIGTEHLLIGMIREGTGVAARVLQKIGVDLARVRLETEKIIGRAPAEEPEGILPFTKHARSAVEFAVEEARGLGHTYLGTEHLLLGLIRESNCTGTRVLQALGIQPADARIEVLEFLGVDPNRGDPSSGGAPKGW